MKNHYFPLKLVGITLGSKCPEKEINQKQFEQLIRNKNQIDNNKENLIEENDFTCGIIVKLSEIKNYR